MNNRKSTLLLALMLAAGFLLGSGMKQTAAGQSQTARCSATVPRDWGEFRGATDQGFAYEDQNGTVRIIRQLPCPGLGTPQIAIELRRE